MRQLNTSPFPFLTNSRVRKQLIAGAQPNDLVTDLFTGKLEPVPFIHNLMYLSDQDLTVVLETGYGRGNHNLDQFRLKHHIELDYLRDHPNPFYRMSLAQLGYFLEHFKQDSDPRVRRQVALQDPSWDNHNDPSYMVRHPNSSVEQIPIQLGNVLHAGYIQTYLPFSSWQATSPIPLVESTEPWTLTYFPTGRASYPECWLLTAPGLKQLDLTGFTHHDIIGAFDKHPLVWYSDPNQRDQHHPYFSTSPIPFSGPTTFETPMVEGEWEILVDPVGGRIDAPAQAVLLIPRQQGGPHRLCPGLVLVEVPILSALIEPLL